MKRALLLMSVLASACSQAEQQDGDSGAGPPAQGATGASAEPPGIECAIGADAFARVCTVEEARSGEGVTLTVRNPQGGFRRLIVTPAGEITAADGAEPATTTALPDGRLEVAIGSDRYRIPAQARR